MTDSSEIGRFGTLRLLKRHDPNTTIAFFPVDDEEVTFGRSNKCSVRLYYAFVSEVHCILQISEERKAFLIVKGSNGVTIDGCEVLPASGQSQDPIVPLTNGSEIEIHTKKFKFEYPPKEIRAALLETPRPSPINSNSRRRSLRMSMISSAQVSSPRKGGLSSPLKITFPTPLSNTEDEIEDLKDQSDVLRTPIKVPACLSEERQILLVEGTGEKTLVFEEEKDLIILEHVEEQSDLPVSRAQDVSRILPASSLLPSTPKPLNSASTSTSPVAQPRHSSVSTAKRQAFQTPPRHPRRSGVSLHRAVVLRSAHRVHCEQERQRSLEQALDEEEEEEVELAVSPERDLGPFELCQDDENDGCRVELNFQGDDENDQADSDESDEDEEDLRKNTIHPLSAPRPAYSGPFETLKAGFELVKKMTFEKSPERTLQTNNGGKDTNNSRSPSPVRRILADLATAADVPKSKYTHRTSVDAANERQIFTSKGHSPSLFGGARRVAVPTQTFAKKEATISDSKACPQRTPDTARSQVSQEERDAIHERRRSALLTPTAVLPPPGPRSSNIMPKHSEEEEYFPGKDRNEDSEAMLEKMKVKLESVQRRSEARKARLSSSPQKTNFLDFGMPSLSLPPPRPSSTGVQSRTLRMAEESLRQMKLEDDDDEDDEEDKKTILPTLSTAPSLSTGKEPRSRTWIAAAAAPQTPSFIGMRSMFKVQTTMATPDMKLDEIFYEADEHEDEDVKGDGRSDEFEVLETTSRLPSRQGVRRKFLEATSLYGNTPQEPAHPIKRAMRKIALEPFIEVHNSHGKFGNDCENVTDEPGDLHSSSTATVLDSTRRVTRSRNVKLANEEVKTAIPIVKRATRQTKKPEVVEQSEESRKTRRGGQTKKQVAVQSQQGEVDAPKLTQRRRTRAK